MKGKIAVLVVVIVGIGLGIVMVIRGQQQSEPAMAIAEPPRVPYENYVSGVGIVESSSENVHVATHISGVVEEVFVQEGDQVYVGEPLFQVDAHDLHAEFKFRVAEKRVAEANVEQAKAILADKRNLYALVKNISDKRAVSIEEISSRRQAVTIAEAGVNTVKAEVNRVSAMMERIQIDLDRSLVKSPIDASVLQVNIHKGEYAVAGTFGEPIMLLGAIYPLHVRVDIDETDAWRFEPTGKAIALLRGNPEVQIPLTFVRVDPYVLPKRSLTGDTSERVDIRVLQVIYSFEPGTLPVYVGQQVDVYMQTRAGGEEQLP